MAESVEHEGPLAEFVALRQEIELLVKAQHQFLVFQLTMTGAIFAFALSQPGRTALLLVVPFSSYLLCGRLARQHTGTLYVAQYIREVLSPQVPGGLGWEKWLSQRSRRRMRNLGSTLPHLFTFAGSSVVALAWTSGLVFANHSPGLAVLWFAGCVACALSAWVVVRVVRADSI